MRIESCVDRECCFSMQFTTSLLYVEWRLQSVLRAYVNVLFVVPVVCALNHNVGHDMTLH